MGALEKELRREELASFRLRELYRRYGYRQYRVSNFEEYDFYARNKSFLVSDSVLTFTDTDGRLMALKPDVTLSIVKNSRDDETALQKFCYNETVYRPSGAYGGFKEILQAGLECVGDLDLYAVGEVLSLAAGSLAVISGSWVLGVSHLGLLSAVLEELTDDETARRQLLRLIGEKNGHELETAAEAAGIGPDGRLRLRTLASLHGPLETTLPELAALGGGEKAAAARDELERLAAMLRDCGGQILLDLSVGGDMRYYNGVIFQGFLEGLPQAVLSGGRYDGLMRKLGKRGGAIGFAVYLDQLERLEPRREYDVDALILYDDDQDPLEVQRAVALLSESGKTVRAERRRSDAIHCRQLLRLRNGGLETLETNA